MLYHLANGSSRVIVTTATMLDLDTNDMRYDRLYFMQNDPDKEGVTGII